MNENIETSKETPTPKLSIPDFISRLLNLETYYMEIIDGSDIDGPEVIGRKTQMGSWVRLDDVRKLIDELKNNL